MTEAYLRRFTLTDLFRVERGNSRYIRKYYAEHPGPFPVYSATTHPEAVTGWIDTYDFDGDYLTWTTNGYAGFVFQRSGQFSATRDVGILSPRPEYRDRISLSFFAPLLSAALQAAALGRRSETGESDYTKIAAGNASKVTFLVPVADDGLPHRGLQDQIATRYERIDGARGRLLAMAEDLRRRMLIVGQSEQAVRGFRVDDLFEVKKGDGGMTAKYILAHPGPYPVHTGSSFRDETAGSVDRFDFDGEYLTWAADGYAGKVYARNGKFSANSHAGVLQPRSTYRDVLYLPFFELVLTQVFEGMAVGRFRPDGSPDYTRVTVGMARQAMVSLPVNSAGMPDHDTQRRFVEHAVPLLRNKAAVEDELARLARSEVVIDWAQGLGPWKSTAISPDAAA